MMIDPCFYAVGVVRRCSTYRVKPYRDDPRTVLVRTFRVAPGTPFLPFGHSFMISDWFPDKFARELRPGVVGFGPRETYSKGEPFPIGLRQPFKEPCGSLRAWEGKGTPELDPPLTWQLAGPSTCCLDLAEVDQDLFADQGPLDLGEQLAANDPLDLGEQLGEGTPLAGNINTGGFTPDAGIGTVAEFEEFADEISTDFATWWSYGSFPVFAVLIQGVTDGTRSATEVNGQLALPNQGDGVWYVIGSPTISGSLTKRILSYDGSNLTFALRRNSAPGTLYLAFQSPGSWDGVSPIMLDPIFSDGKWDNTSATCAVFPIPE